MTAAYAATVPSTAPASASAPAVTAVIVRRVEPLAPVAARVRRSLAVSLRMRPTDMARMASARKIPKAVAQLMISAAVGGCGDWMSQPDVMACSPSSRIACEVITVLGAEVPDGRALTSWITGLARQSLAGQGKDTGPWA